MKTLHKIILSSILITVIVVTTVVFITPGVAVRHIINHYSLEMTGIKIQCDSIRMAPVIGKGTIKGLTFYNINDKRFQSEYLMRIPTVIVKLDKKALTNKLIKLKINAERPIINYEVVSGTSNITEAVKVISGFHENESGRKKRNKKYKNKKYNPDNYYPIIDKLSIENAGVNLYVHDNATQPKSAEAHKIVIPDIVISNVTTETNQTQDPYRIILSSVFKAINTGLAEVSIKTIRNNINDNLKKSPDIKSIINNFAK